MVRRHLPDPHSSACPLSPQPAPLPGNHRVVSFEAILAGLAGPREAAAAKKWVEAGSVVEAPPTDPALVLRETSPACYETRVYDSSTGEDTDVEEDARAAKPAGSAAGQPGKARRQRRPASNVNEYSRAAFVGHSDTMGMMARRRARSSHAGEEAERPVPGSAAADRAALPEGWSVYDVDLEGPRGTRVAGGRLLVSPEGAVAESLPAAKALATAEAANGSVGDIKSAVEWVRQLGITRKANLMKEVDDSTARMMVTLQRRRVVLMDAEEDRIASDVKGGRPRVGKREGGGVEAGVAGGSVPKKQKRDASEPLSGQDVGTSIK